MTLVREVPLLTFFSVPSASTVSTSVLLLLHWTVTSAPAGATVATSVMISSERRVMSVLFKVMEVTLTSGVSGWDTSPPWLWLVSEPEPAEEESWLPWDWLASWVTEQCRKELGTANQDEVPGYENVWLERYGISRGNYPDGAAGDVWLIRRGNTVVWAKTDMELGAQWLDDLLERLEVAET